MKPGAAVPQYTSQGYGPPKAPGWIHVSRGAALGIACITACNLLEVFAFNTSAVRCWLCNFRMVSQPICIAVLSMLATASLMYSIQPVLPGSVRLVAIGLVTVVAVFVGWDLLDVIQQVPQDLRQIALSRPLGIFMLLAVAGMGIMVSKSLAFGGNSSILIIASSSLWAVLGFVVVNLQSGSIGDPLPAGSVPAILLPECSFARDGTPSEESSDSIRTASRLYLEGHANRIILSGGADEGNGSKTTSIKELALKAGVPESALLTDPGSISVAQAIQFAVSQPEFRDDRRIIVVSQWYQLARIRMIGRRSQLQVMAVPAEQRPVSLNRSRLYALEVYAFLQTCLVPAKELLRR